MDEFHRKRQIWEVADAEAPPRASRPRARVKQEVKDERPNGNEDDQRQSSESESNLSTIEDEGRGNGDTRDSSYEHAIGEVVERNDNAAEQVSKGQHPASRGIPQSWEDASKADRVLVTMRSKGLGWDEVAKAWKEETGKDIAHIELLNRFNRVKDNLQTLREGDSERLLAAVNHVKAAFKREKWQLVKTAMSQAGAAEYSKGFIQHQYKKLTRASRPTITAPSHNQKSVGERNSERITLTKDLHVAEAVTSTYWTPVNREDTKQGLRPVRAVDPKTAPSLNVTKKPDDVASVSNAIIPSPEDSGVVQLGSQMEGVADVGKTVEKGHAKGSAHVEPGSLATNAIIVDDIDSDLSAVSAGKGTVVPVSRAIAGSTPSEARSVPDPLATVSRSGPQFNMTTSRVGSATNRGPARFTDIHKSIEDEIARKQRKAAKSLPDSMGINPGNLTTESSSRNLDMLVNQKYTSHEPPSSVRQRMAMQHDGPVEKGSLHRNAISVQELLVPSPPQPASIQGEANNKVAMPQTSVQNGPGRGSEAVKPLAYQKPSDLQAPVQRESGQQRSPKQCTENDSRDTPSTPANVVDAETAAGSPRKSLTRDQLEHMLRHKALSDANRNKTWDIIARECGVTATLAELSVALEQAGYPRISRTPDPPQPAISALPKPSTEPEAIVAPHAPAPPTPVNQQSVTPVGSTAPPRAFETPVPASTSSLDGTPKTRSKGGRPLGSKNKPKDQSREKGSPISPTHSKTPVSKRKGQARGERSAASKAAQSAGMKAAWARRKERAANERRDGSPRSSTTAETSLKGSSVATFAADILAAAAAAANPTPAPTPGNQATPPDRSEALDAEPVDLLTGESMFAQHADDPAPAQAPPARKIPGTNDRPEASEPEP